MEPKKKLCEKYVKPKKYLIIMWTDKYVEPKNNYMKIMWNQKYLIILKIEKICGTKIIFNYFVNWKIYKTKIIFNYDVNLYRGFHHIGYIFYVIF